MPFICVEEMSPVDRRLGRRFVWYDSGDSDSWSAAIERAASILSGNDDHVRVHHTSPGSADEPGRDDPSLRAQLLEACRVEL